MDWIFDGIGTEIILLIIGIITGAAGYKVILSKTGNNKQVQKSGSGSIQIQQNNVPDAKESKISASVGSDNHYTQNGDYVNGNKIVQNEIDELDIRNFEHYSNAQIEGVIDKGNCTTLRKCCLLLIINERQDYLIQRCIKKMDNDKEKYKLLEELAARDFEGSEYFMQICDSIQNDVYQEKVIKLFIAKDAAEYIEDIFARIQNNRYIFNSLAAVYDYDRDIFDMLYDNGNCFDNERYHKKMRDWLKDRAGT